MVNEGTLALLHLLKSAQAPLSGPRLAQELGISRVALWKRFEALRAAGYEVHADRLGYRLGGGDRPLPWEFPGDPIVHFDTVASTMDEAFRLGLEGREEALVVAEHQSSGRGRQDRSWVSAGGNLLVTWLVRPRLPVAYAGALALEALTVMAEVVRDHTALTLTVKWPNDLWAGDRKVAGVLVEACGPVEAPRFYTVGLGLNVHGLPALDRPATSLDGLGVAADRRALLRDWRARLRPWIDAPSPQPARWEAWAAPTLNTHPWTVETFDGRRVQDRIVGFDRTGSLRLADPRQDAVRFGEVTRTEGVVA